jgi:hypothetical protein
MKFPRTIGLQAIASAALALSALVLAPTPSAAQDAGSGGVVFQRPRQGRTVTPPTSAGVQFRSSTSAAAAPVATTAPPTTPRSNPLRENADASVVPAAATTALTASRVAARPISTAPRPVAPTAEVATFAQPGDDLSGAARARHTRAIQAASIQPWVDEQAGTAVDQAGYCDCGEPTCGICCEPACGVAEPGCCFAEPECGLVEPGCGLVDPCCGPVEECPILGDSVCGCGEPACGCAEPDCGIVGCGSCVGNPGPDWWCFPVCLPRFKDLRFWAGVHGFKGSRDAPLFGGAGDGNFGFQEGFNIGGRAPLVSLVFPQLSYQLGFQAVQSQLHGLSDGSTDDRSQQFVTAGLFRRVPAGVQLGVVWDMLRDDFQAEEDFHQLRYELSFKSRAGREFGFWGATHTNDKSVAGVNYQAVDQYAAFLRCHFRDGGSLRFWGGGTDDNEGLFGGDFVAPLNNRWSVQTGFNYLITDEADGTVGAREESWNVGINMVWVMGRVAKSGASNPHAPLFPTADNGWLFIDRRP